MTHAESKERRAEIAALARLQLTVSEIVERTGRSPQYVWCACCEHGVRPKRSPPRYSRGEVHPIRVLARLKDGMIAARQAEVYNVSGEYIRQIERLAVELGLLEK